MRTRTGLLALLLTTGMTLAPTAVWGQDHVNGQDVPPEDPPSILPLYHDRPETGGFFAATEFLWWQMSNPIRSQTIAVRGFVDVDGSVQNFVNMTNGNSGATSVPGTFFGSHLQALNSDQVGGPNTYVPGFGITLGWRFGDGVALEFTWRHLVEAKYNAVATEAAPNDAMPGFILADSFLYSPVFGFPPEFAGPLVKLQFTPSSGQGGAAAGFTQVLTLPTGTIAASTGPGANDTAAAITGAFALTTTANGTSTGGAVIPGAAYGIWNGATVMTESFVQRHDEFELIGRIPVYESDMCRVYGLAGARISQIWERFQWTTFDYPAVFLSSPTVTIVNTTDIGVAANMPPRSIGVATVTQINAGQTVFNGAGQAEDPVDVAVYSNIVSNMMYGPLIGCGSEWYLGHGFSFSLDLRASLLGDFVVEEAKYERMDRFISNHRTIKTFTIAPEFDALFSFWWYPTEGVQVKVGYDAMAYFNTVSAQAPVSFNYGALDPPFDKNTFRLLTGVSFGIGFIF